LLKKRREKKKEGKKEGEPKGGGIGKKRKGERKRAEGGERWAGTFMRDESAISNKPIRVSRPSTLLSKPRGFDLYR
jgi:hypothetical protein